MAKKGTIKKGIFGLFQLFSASAMRAKPYKEGFLPTTVTAPLEPQVMKVLQVISCRIGAPRTAVAMHILNAGIAEAAAGCGFTMDENWNIPEEQLNWDCSARSAGISFPGSDEQEGV